MASKVSTSLLELEKVDAGYNGAPVIREVDLHVGEGEIVALLGSNGAGKTTTMLTLAGEVRPLKGSVHWLGAPTSSPLHKRAKAGLRLITEERSVFMSLSVADNLRLAHRDLRPCLDIFPDLKALLSRRAGLLSGGEQQMLALGRALGGGCRVLLVDELSLGLSPVAVERLLKAIRAAADKGTAVVLVEQNLDRALQVSDRAYILKRGRIVMEGTSAEMAARRKDVESVFLSS